MTFYPKITKADIRQDVHAFSFSVHGNRMTRSSLYALYSSLPK